MEIDNWIMYNIEEVLEIVMKAEKIWGDYMRDNYTEMLKIAANKYYSDDEYDNDKKSDNELDIEEVLEKADFRPFSEGLTMTLVEAGYLGKRDDIDEKYKYIVEKLKEKNLYDDSMRKVVKQWITGKTRPDSQPKSRTNVYKLCFSLDMSPERARKFFDKVYFNRCFNFHNIEEVVYFFCMQHKKSYLEAWDIIKKIHDCELKNNIATVTDISAYTKYVQNSVLNIETESELVYFLQSHKKEFEVWNQSAFTKIESLRKEILGDENSKLVILKLKKEVQNKIKSGKRLNKIDTEGLEQCGLLVKEILWNAEHRTRRSYVCYDLAEELDNNSMSNSFFLRKIYIEPKIKFERFKKTETMTLIAKSFPSEKVFNTVTSLDKIGTMESYVQIRKVVILLHFYSFWCKIKISKLVDEQYNTDELRKIYIDEANECLSEVGYDDLYPGNPYDWLYICASVKEDPLYSLREIMASIMDQCDM